MSLTIRQVGPCFVGDVDGIDLTKRCRPRTLRQSMPAWTSTLS
jgi:hypothetical protein